MIPNKQCYDMWENLKYDVYRDNYLYDKKWIYWNGEWIYEKTRNSMTEKRYQKMKRYHIGNKKRKERISKGKSERKASALHNDKYSFAI